ncbi:MAG TPA: hypothetical protein VKY44_08530 [Flavobacterium sp.]|nr:hypothetical protein [Flavobacterium sp.]
MKKFFLSFIVIGALMFSCKKAADKIQKPMTDPPVESVNEAPEIIPEVTSEIPVPEFQYAEADQFAKEYVAFVKDYIVADNHNDSEAIRELGTKINEYQKRGVELAKRVPQEEAVAFQDFLNSIEQHIK